MSNMKTNYRRAIAADDDNDDSHHPHNNTNNPHFVDYDEEDEEEMISLGLSRESLLVPSGSDISDNNNNEDDDDDYDNNAVGGVGDIAGTPNIKVGTNRKSTFLATPAATTTTPRGGVGVGAAGRLQQQQQQRGPPIMRRTPGPMQSSSVARQARHRRTPGAGNSSHTDHIDDADLSRSQHARTPVMSGGRGSSSNRIGKTPHKQQQPHSTMTSSSLVTPSNKQSSQISTMTTGGGGGPMETPDVGGGRQLYTPAHFTLAKNADLHMENVSARDAFSPATIRMTDSLEKLLTEPDDDDMVEQQQQQSMMQTTQNVIPTDTTTNNGMFGQDHSSSTSYTPKTTRGTKIRTNDHSMTQAEDDNDIRRGAFRRIQSTGDSDEEYYYEEILEDMHGGGSIVGDETTRTASPEEDEDEEEAEISQINLDEDDDVDDDDDDDDDDIDGIIDINDGEAPVAAALGSIGGAFKPPVSVAKPSVKRAVAVVVPTVKTSEGGDIITTKKQPSSVAAVHTPKPQRTTRSHTTPNNNAAAAYHGGGVQGNNQGGYYPMSPQQQHHQQQQHQQQHHQHGYFGGDLFHHDQQLHHHHGHPPPHPHLQYPHHQYGAAQQPHYQQHHHQHSPQNFHLPSMPSPQHSAGFGLPPSVSPLTLPAYPPPPPAHHHHHHHQQQQHSMHHTIPPEFGLSHQGVVAGGGDHWSWNRGGGTNNASAAGGFDHSIMSSQQQQHHGMHPHHLQQHQQGMMAGVMPTHPNAAATTIPGHASPDFSFHGGELSGAVSPFNMPHHPHHPHPHHNPFATNHYHQYQQQQQHQQQQHHHHHQSNNNNSYSRNHPINSPGGGGGGIRQQRQQQQRTTTQSKDGGGRRSRNSQRKLASPSPLPWQQQQQQQQQQSLPSSPIKQQPLPSSPIKQQQGDAEITSFVTSPSTSQSSLQQPTSAPNSSTSTTSILQQAFPGNLLNMMMPNNNNGASSSSALLEEQLGEHGGSSSDWFYPATTNAVTTPRGGGGSNNSLSFSTMDSGGSGGDVSGGGPYSKQHQQHRVPVPEPKQGRGRKGSHDFNVQQQQQQNKPLLRPGDASNNRFRKKLSGKQQQQQQQQQQIHQQQYHHQQYQHQQQQQQQQQSRGGTKLQQQHQQQQPHHPTVVVNNESSKQQRNGGEQFVMESPTERQAFKEFGRHFRQKENESLDAAREYALACLDCDARYSNNHHNHHNNNNHNKKKQTTTEAMYLPPATHWRVHLELADVAKRDSSPNRIHDARSHYQQACALQPRASQGWLEYSKLEEESGNLTKCAKILTDGLQYCITNENLLVRAVKFYERLGDLESARRLLSRLKYLSIDKSWKTMLEGALLEARAGRYSMAREVLKYLTHYVPWYGPLYLAHTKLERDYGSPTEAFSIVEKGLKELPRYGPLYFQAFRLLEKEDLSQKAYHLPRTMEMVTRADSISRELLWKVHLEAAQMQERAAVLAIEETMHSTKNNMTMDDRLPGALQATTRKSYAKAIMLCPPNLSWKIWLVSGRAEVSCGNTKGARALFLRAHDSVSEKGRSTVLLECARLEEFVGDLTLSRSILCKARQLFGKSDWKVWLSSVNLECRCGLRERAIAFAQEALNIHRGTGRLWAALIQLRHDDGGLYQMKVLKCALQAVPKSGEVWCEGARIYLNPFSPTFDLRAASRHLSFAARFTPQYGDSFLEQLRLDMIDQWLIPLATPFINNMCEAFLSSDGMPIKDARQLIAEHTKNAADVVKTQLEESGPLFTKDVLDTSELELRCSSADPNYGHLWFQCRNSPIDTAREVIARSKTVMSDSIVEYSYLYIAAIVRRSGVLMLIHQQDEENGGTTTNQNAQPKLFSHNWDAMVDRQLRSVPSLDKMLSVSFQGSMFTTGCGGNSRNWDKLSLTEKRRQLFGSDSLLS